MYLGHIVNATGVKPDPAKVKALHGWNIPPDCDNVNDTMSSLERSTVKKRTVHEVRRLLGFMNYFNRFIPKYAELAGPLHAQTSDKIEKWTMECTDNWNTLKQLLLKATLMYPASARLSLKMSVLHLESLSLRKDRGVPNTLTLLRKRIAAPADPIPGVHALRTVK